MGASHVAQMVKNLPANAGATPGFLPAELHGQRSLAGYSPCGCKESDMTEQLTLALTSGEGRGRTIWELQCRRYKPLGIR